MNKMIFKLFAVVAVACAIASCGSKKGQNAASNNLEQEAINAGKASKKELTEELKNEVSRFFKNMSKSDFSNQFSADNPPVSIVDIDFMLPLSEVDKLNTNTQKARACGMYLADLQILKFMDKPTTKVENTLLKLCQELDINFAADIIKEQAPVDASKEERTKFMREQEDKLINAMIDDGKVGVEIELLGGMLVEYACLWSSPALVIKTDTLPSGFNEEIAGDLNVLRQIITDLAEYYPDLTQLGDVINPLKEMVGSVELARKSQKEINDIRAKLLK